MTAVMVGLTPVSVSPQWPLEGRYRLDDRIATGGMGEVWRATDLVLDRPVAVKLLRPGLAGDEEYLTRFRAEARYAGLLSHPGIAKVYDYREADPPYLVMELVNGPSLAKLLEEGPIGPARMMNLVAQASRALQAAHAAGLVHRDIKPGNLLISQGGQVKITDFGIAHSAHSAPLTRPGVLMGTPPYLAPERAVGAPASPAADLYALGIVAYQCLTGRPPFTGEPLAVALAHQQQPLPPLPPSVPADVAALVADLTAKDPSARPASAGQVAERAEHLHAALTGTAAIQRRTPGRRIPAGIPARAALALAAVVITAATGWALARTHRPASAQPQPSAPAATQQSSPHASHPAHLVMPARGTATPGVTRAAASRLSRRPAVARNSAAPSVIPTRSGTPARAEPRP